MTTKTRVATTVALGLVLGLFSWLGDTELSPSHGVHVIFGSTPAKIAVAACFILVPLLVGRFWVVGALAGPVIALAILGAAGETVYEDGTASPLNYVAIFLFIYLGILMEMLVGIRLGVGFLLQRRADARRSRRPLT